MLELNDMSGASGETQAIIRKLREKLPNGRPLFGCEMGIAWGGGIEKIGEAWLGYGMVWGFDTFEGHPKQLAEICPITKEDGGHNAHATTCLDPYYREFSAEQYSYGWIRQELDKKSLHNVILVKGLIDEKTNISFIPMLDYVLLDMDFPISMRNGYNLVKDKIVKNGYLCLHDVVPPGHIKGLNELYLEIKATGEWEVISENEKSLLAILRKK